MDPNQPPPPADPPPPGGNPPVAGGGWVVVQEPGADAPPGVDPAPQQAAAQPAQGAAPGAAATTAGICRTVHIYAPSEHDKYFAQTPLLWLMIDSHAAAIAHPANTK